MGGAYFLLSIFPDFIASTMNLFFPLIKKCKSYEKGGCIIKYSVLPIKDNICAVEEETYMERTSKESARLRTVCKC